MGSTGAREHDLGAVFVLERPHLWGLCYRMTGDAAEAEDLVQQTFERALARPPADVDRPWRPWLTRVATNLAIDGLRRRQHRAYTGPWLPAPVPTQALAGLEPRAADDVETRYELIESATFAFLAALERLEPRQRVVLILADVVGHTGPEIARFLETSAANVRQILSRARAALHDYDQARCRPTPQLAQASRRAIEGFFGALAAGDASGMARWLTDDAICISDGGGEFRAAYKVVRGAANVVALELGLASRIPPPIWVDFAELNGLPALLFRLPDGFGDDKQARRVLARVELEPGGGRIAALHLVLASTKLSAVSFGPDP